MAQRKDNLLIRVWRRSRTEISLIPDRWQSLGRFSRATDPNKPMLLVNSIPKSGTYLLGKLATMLGLYDLNVHILDGGYWDYNRKGKLHKWKSLEGYTEFVNPRWVQQPTPRSLRRILPGQFAVAHLGRTPAIVESIRATGLKHVLIYRDPRDVIVSWAQFVTNRPDRNPPFKTHEYFSQVLDTDEQRIEATISGVPGLLPDMWEAIFAGKTEWLDDPCTCCVRFEDLVGERGGSSAQQQRQAIGRVLQHLEIPATEELHQRIGEDLHGGKTHTFNKGQVGTWRDVMSNRNIQSFKEHAGDLLVRLGYESDDNW